MNHVKHLMINEYHMTDRDWMGYELVTRFDYHHIIKKEDGGKITRQNGAILEHVGHQYLHIIETKDYERYVFINMILKQINQQGHMPTQEQLIVINYVLDMFEREHCSDRNKKGEILIKEEYTRRLIRR